MDGDLPSFAEVDAELCAAGEFFEIETVDVRGIPTRTWKNAPRNLREVIEAGTRNSGEGTFIVLGDERISHARHFELVVQLATAFVRDVGVRPGDRVAIAMRNLPEWSVAYFAATAVGAVAVPLNGFWNGAELAFAITDCDPKVLVADGERLERIAPHTGEFPGTALIGTRLDDRAHSGDLPAGIRPLDEVFAAAGDASALPDVPIDPDDPASIFYTSGTTSRPKGVYGTHRNVCSNLVSMMYATVRALRRRGEQAPPRRGPTVMMVPLPHADPSKATSRWRGWFFCVVR
ncbi:class I adenylate-forming enzyme family protein [Frankia sp. AgKG'84/4]|uniref:class I adenylate-forming enzyme family protein n=1 Tax=Frankia sp. AgKG'84/4 TaxID=573490 RepID=UPI00200D4252|nr:class I adenylate-forming enzyme family protein [Frankia sp. AgKG'84/4]MCL9794698.1 acyl--CoA ligase [Frankia sp. AgKG'84/4]